ncbi:type II secretion system secretin GspD [Halopseudomonas salegens]|nr:type II secretion system secretin GspD [Halopseudomonas salegens]
MKSLFLPSPPLLLKALLLASFSILSACAAFPDNKDVDTRPINMMRTLAEDPDSFAEEDVDEEPREARTLLEQPGTGRFLQDPGSASAVTDQGDGVNINFESAPLADVLRVILGDLLEVPYSLESGIDGTITLVSTDPVPRDVLIEMLESALEVQGIAMVKGENGIYRVGNSEALRREVPLQTLSQERLQGYSVRIVPLQHLGVAEAQKILEPLGMGPAILRADPLRNILMLGAAGPQMENALRTLRMLDVDVLEGMSIGIYEVANLDAAALVERVNAMLSTPEMEGLAGAARMVPLEELNSVMVIAPRADTLNTVRDWLNRLDSIGLDDEQAGTQLYVYNVENGEAVQIANLLGQIFGGTTGGSQSRTSGTTAPGLERSELSSGEGSSGGSGSSGASISTASNRSSGSTSTTTDSGTRIVADEVNNSLLIMASAKEWRSIRSALDKLDKAPAQVLVEVSIWEVTLSDELSFGIDWFFNTNTSADGTIGGGRLSLQDGGSVSRAAPGFSYLFTGSDWRAVINTLAAKSDVRSLSSPSILVLDNREAKIQVGAQQPFRSSQTVNTGSDVLTQNVELKDTGVMLSVKPRVNAGGLVVMDIQQEVTDVGELDQATGQRTFLKRNIESSVAIQSGDTIILGGLIQDRNTDSDAGIPWLSQVPGLGYLFGTTSQESNRTELLVTISPRAINQYQDFDRIGDEFRDKMQGLAESFREEFSTEY